MEEVRAKLGFERMIVVESIGRSGGLAMLWKEAEYANLISLSQNHIDVEICYQDTESWRLTGIYGEPDRTKRKKTWDLLWNLARDWNLPWCLICDLNNIVAQSEKKGGAPYPRWLLEGFNEVLMELGLSDVELTGHQYTWEKGRNTTAWTEIRLDRALVNGSWLSLFPLAKLYNLEGSPSDHSPLLLEPKQRNGGNRKKRFRFENAWLMEPLCAAIVKDSWEDTNCSNILQRVDQCAKKLEIWGREITGCFNRRIKECKDQMKRYRSRCDAQAMEQYAAAKKQLFLILDQKEIFCRQRLKQLWLQSGDKNTKFFHSSCNTRRRTNQIFKLKAEDGRWVEW